MPTFAEDKTLTHYGMGQKAVNDLLTVAVLQLEATGDVINDEFAGYLNFYRYILNESVEASLNSVDHVQLIGIMIENPRYFLEIHEFKKNNPNTFFRSNLPAEAYDWGRNFLKQFLIEIRKSICSSTGPYTKLQREGSAYPRAVATAISASLMNFAGVSNPVALGVSIFILLLLAKITQNAFCNMTDDEVLELIDTKSKVKPRRCKNN